MNPFFKLRGIGNTASFLSGIVDRGRQNQYMYDQYSSLGQLDALPLSDFQPVSNNMYFAEGGSIVDYAKASGRDASFSSRKRLAEELGITGYKGTADQNLKLLTLLKEQDGTPHFIHGTEEEASHTETEGDVDYRLRNIQNKYAQLQGIENKRSFRPQVPHQDIEQPRSLQRGYTPNINDQDYLKLLSTPGVQFEKTSPSYTPYFNQPNRNIEEKSVPQVAPKKVDFSTILNEYDKYSKLPIERHNPLIGPHTNKIGDQDYLGLLKNDRPTVRTKKPIAPIENDLNKIKNMLKNSGLYRHMMLRRNYN